MKDIFDIKQILLGLPIDITYSLIYITFFIIIILVYKHYKNIFNNKKDEIIELKKIEINFFELLQKIKEKYFSETKEIFYQKLSEFIRLFLEDKYSKKVSSMTFEEINNLKIDENIKDLLKNIYFKEYAKEIKDSEEIRKKLIGEVEKLINPYP